MPAEEQKQAREKQFKNDEVLFKEITEAYSVLGEAATRKKYDVLIFGESASETSSTFGNQDAYDYWGGQHTGEEAEKKRRKMSEQEFNVRDRLRKYKDYDDFLKTYENHRDNHEARGKLYREEGFDKLNDKYGVDYNHYEAQDNPNDPMNKNYTVYRERFYEKYWDTKENDAYFSQSLSTRAWITLKKVMHFCGDSAALWLGMASIFVVFNALNQSKRLRTTNESQNE